MFRPDVSKNCLAVLAARSIPVHRDTVRRLFALGVILKGMNGILEVLGGFVFLFAGRQTLSALVFFLTAHELSEDPHDWIATSLRRSIQHVSSDTALFASAYLLGHGVIKVLLATGLLRGRRWSYPAALWFLATFVLYQLYRVLHTHSLALLSLTVLDIIVMGLIWSEYQFRKRTRRASA